MRQASARFLCTTLVPDCVGGFVGGDGVWIEQLPGVKLIASIAISPWKLLPRIPSNFT